MSDLTNKINNFIEKNIVMPKAPKVNINSNRKKGPKASANSMPVTPKDAMGEVATQLTPKGRYTSPGDVVHDIRESKRLGEKIAGTVAGAEKIKNPATNKLEWKKKLPKIS